MHTIYQTSIFSLLYSRRHKFGIYCLPDGKEKNRITSVSWDHRLSIETGIYRNNRKTIIKAVSWAHKMYLWTWTDWVSSRFCDFTGVSCHPSFSNISFNCVTLQKGPTNWQSNSTNMLDSIYKFLELGSFEQYSIWLQSP